MCASYPMAHSFRVTYCALQVADKLKDVQKQLAALPQGIAGKRTVIKALQSAMATPSTRQARN